MMVLVTPLLFTYKKRYIALYPLKGDIELARCGGFRNFEGKWIKEYSLCLTITVPLTFFLFLKIIVT